MSQANAALLSTESPGHPPVTAADLAAANGHSGLAAFLGESLLNELLGNLKIENRRLDGALSFMWPVAVQTTSASATFDPHQKQCLQCACSHSIEATNVSTPLRRVPQRAHLTTI